MLLYAPQNKTKVPRTTLTSYMAQHLPFWKNKMANSSAVRALHKKHQQTYHRYLTVTDSKETGIPLNPSTIMAPGKGKK
jgi:hypothetical protein